VTTVQRAALQRLILLAAAWAVGETLMRQLGLPGLAIPVGVLMAVAAYVATQGLGQPKRRGGDVIYWRGRRIDRDDLQN
jgi:hypothetical protein